MGTWPGTGVLGAVPLRPGPRGAPGPRRVEAPDGRLPGARVRVDVVHAEARAAAAPLVLAARGSRAPGCARRFCGSFCGLFRVVPAPAAVDSEIQAASAAMPREARASP